MLILQTVRVFIALKDTVNLNCFSDFGLPLPAVSKALETLVDLFNKKKNPQPEQPAAPKVTQNVRN